MRILIVRRRVEKRNNIPNGLSSARGAENRYTDAKEEGVLGGGAGKEMEQFHSCWERDRESCRGTGVKFSR